MKESRYNYFFQYDGKDLAFNSMTCAFAEIDNDFYQAMQAVRQGESLAEMDKELLKKMEEGGYIIDDCADEMRELKFRNMNGKFQSQNLGLTIAPTLSCNFACPYCYEDRRVVFMDTEVQDGIVRLAQRTADHHGNISVTWYGGEPLLAKDTIQSLSERIIPYCDERGVSYDLKANSGNSSSYSAANSGRSARGPPICQDRTSKKFQKNRTASRNAAFPTVSSILKHQKTGRNAHV